METNGITRVIESVQTVVPREPTDPRQFRQVSTKENLGPGIFQRRFHVVLYYKKVKEDSGWIAAGRIKASLGNALVEQPLLAGRLLRSEDADGGLQVVSNDSGVRLFEAQIDMNLEEFLGLKGKREEEEAQLVIWEDLDEQNPQFSPLLFVQVTNFKCGGYSIGFSCSILLADPLAMISFIKRWACINSNMVSEFTELPLFHSHNFRKTGYSPNISKVSNLGKDSDGQTLIFKLATEDQNFYEMQKAVAMLCIEETERIIGKKLPSTFSLYVKGEFGEIKVEKISRDDFGTKSTGILNGLVHESWDESGVHEVTIQEGNKPAGVAHWVSSTPEEREAIVMVILASGEGISGTKIVVTIPNEN